MKDRKRSAIKTPGNGTVPKREAQSVASSINPLFQPIKRQFLEGKTDAAFGRMPEYSDEIYLEGYIAGIKELPADLETKKIQHYSPHKHFAFGWIDGDPEYRDQFGEF